MAKSSQPPATAADAGKAPEGHNGTQVLDPVNADLTSGQTSTDPLEGLLLAVRAGSDNQERLQVVLADVYAQLFCIETALKMRRSGAVLGAEGLSFVGTSKPTYDLVRRRVLEALRGERTEKDLLGDGPAESARVATGAGG